MASVRHTARAGAILLVAACSVACDRTTPRGGPATLELLNDTIQLPDSVTLIEVEVRVASGGEFEPAAFDASRGDVIRFTAGDRGSHAIAFDGAALQPAARDFLERTAQLRGPPLISPGAAWIITLGDAPPGRYPFRCLTHNADGVLTVLP